MLGHQGIECGDRFLPAMVKEMRRDGDQSGQAESDQPVSDVGENQGAKSHADGRPHGRIIIQRTRELLLPGRDLEMAVLQFDRKDATRQALQAEFVR